jgi:cyanophycinase
MHRVLLPTFCLTFTWAAAAAVDPLEPLSGTMVLAGEEAKELAATVFRRFIDDPENARLLQVTAEPATVAAWKEWKLAKHTLLRADAVTESAVKDASAIWLDAGTAAVPVALRHSLINRVQHGGLLGVVGPMMELPELLPGVDVRYAVPGEKPVHPGPRSGIPLIVLPRDAMLVVRGRDLLVLGGGTVTVNFGKSSTKPARQDSYRNGDRLDLYQLRRAAVARASDTIFPPLKPQEPEVKSGSLVIVGGGSAGPEIWKRFITLAGGPEAKILVIPTAMEDPVPIVNPVEATMLKMYGARHVDTLHTRSRTRANDPAFSEPLTRAQGVWFGGGRQWRFVEAYEGTLTEKRFQELLARGGVIGGSSAGASIQGEYLPRGHPLGNTVIMAEGYERGFCFLPGTAIDQHFFARKRTADMTQLMRAYPQLLGIGIDEGTAIVVNKSIAEVIGRGNVAFYDYRNRQESSPSHESVDYLTVSPGQRYDLKSRHIIK